MNSTEQAKVMAFPWQAQQWQTIISAQSQQRLPHALLFVGPAGIGKRHFANAVAAYLLCLSPTAVGDACGQCKSCYLSQSLNHPDFVVIEPDGAGGQIKIDQIRLANEFLSKTSQQGGKRVLVIDSAETINVNAANALLKTLEEPAQEVFIILVSSMLSRLLPTVRSRCQRHDFFAPSYEQSKHWLLSQQYPLAEIEDALVLSFQRPLLASELINNKSLDMRQQVISELLALLQHQQSFLDVSKRWKTYDFILLTQYLCACLVAIVKHFYQHDTEILVDDDLQTLYSLVENHGSLATLFALYQRTLEVYDLGLSTANISRELLIENLLIYWQSGLS